MKKEDRKAVANIAESIELDENDICCIIEMSIETGKPESLIRHQYKMDLAIGALLELRNEIEEITQ